MTKMDILSQQESSIENSFVPDASDISYVTQVSLTKGNGCGKVPRTFGSSLRDRTRLKKAIHLGFNGFSKESIMLHERASLHFYSHGILDFHPYELSLNFANFSISMDEGR